MMDIHKRPLFVLEMANNHQGSVEHGLRIVREMKQVCNDFFPDFALAFKLQYRDIDTFIHPEYRQRMDLKFVKRYTSTRLSWDDYKRIKDEITAQGFLSICTPWDELSVEKIVAHGFDFIKIPSCYATDWPLLEKIVQYNLPIIASTAGVSLDAIDRLASFLGHRRKRFALMHCVGEYSTREENLQLNQIDLLKARYANVEVGYSTHESPDNVEAVGLALAKGATIFEKHVGVPTDSAPLNAYSANPQQVRRWLEGSKRALAMLGVSGQRYPFTDLELSTLHELHRGVFAKTPIKAGELVTPEKVFYAIPNSPDQAVANDMSKYTALYPNRDVPAGGPVMLNQCRRVETRQQILDIVQKVKTFLKQSGTIVPSQLELEISHHYGLDNFYKCGSTFVTVVNRQYIKRVIIMLPGQTHPGHIHKEREETYHILYGSISLRLNGVESECKTNDVIVIPHGAEHGFSTQTGAIIEEVSSAHKEGDSYYADSKIDQNLNRKTFITHWMD